MGTSIPTELLQRPQWLVWRPVPKKDKPDKVDKVPTSPYYSNENIDKTLPDNWHSSEEAMKHVEERAYLYGVGFFIDKRDPFTC